MPDNIVRDIPLIQRYARHNEAEDYRFREFLKAHLAISNAELDAVVAEITDEVWSQIDCTACSHCCSLQIDVDAADIRRLASRLGMTQRHFSARYVRIAEDRTKRLASSPCAFLGPDGRCTVYEDRPAACRDFPYLHSPCFRSRSIVMIENTAVCPIVFNVWQRLKARFPRRSR